MVIQLVGGRTGVWIRVIWSLNAGLIHKTAWGIFLKVNFIRSVLRCNSFNGSSWSFGATATTNLAVVQIGLCMTWAHWSQFLLTIPGPYTFILGTQVQYMMPCPPTFAHAFASHRRLPSTGSPSNPHRQFLQALLTYHIFRDASDPFFSKSNRNSPLFSLILTCSCIATALITIWNYFPI